MFFLDNTELKNTPMLMYFTGVCGFQFLKVSKQNKFFILENILQCIRKIKSENKVSVQIHIFDVGKLNVYVEKPLTIIYT